MKFNLSADHAYVFAYQLLIQTGVSTNGIKIGLNFPAATVVSAVATVPSTGDGTAAIMSGWITQSGDSVTGTSSPTVNVPLVCTIEGNIIPSTNGTLELAYAGELSTSQGIIMRQGSVGILKDVT
jgi:hypothetical protein